MMRSLACWLSFLVLVGCGSVSTVEPDAGDDDDASTTVTLTITHSGNGGGTVISSPAGIDCGATCTMTVDAGTTVTLTATADSDSTFGGWAGGGCTGTGTCQATLTADVTIDAAFSIGQLALTVAKAGNGTGTVTSAPSGINCGADCEELYDPGTMVTLTAVADSNSQFGGWSGDSCSGTGSCVVTMNAAQLVTATFTLATYTLSVTKSGTGTGTITSSPAGINCGTDCTEDYVGNPTVTLTASPDSDSTFSGWSGACTGMGPCVVSMTSAQSVNAAFTCSGGSQTFNYTGGNQTFTVPGCVTSITIDAYGAAGGTGVAAGGLGGRAFGNRAVTGGTTITVVVGGAGLTAPAQGNSNGFAGGFNGGGRVHEYLTWTTQGEGPSGTGGGASDVRIGGTALANRVIVAAGGGGGANSGLTGGIGGGTVGGAGASGGTNSVGGGGGTQSAGGSAAQCCLPNYPNQPGSLGQGGTAYRDASGSGGGGGGYYGGGGGQFAGGGGGSSYIGGVTGGFTTAGVRVGNGVVAISW